MELNKIIVLYYFLINLLLFCAMGLDKLRAKKNKWRIAETTLFTISFLGGAIGGFIGMFAFRHKICKYTFHIMFSISIVLHLTLLYITLSL
ncbi:MAG: DUF1294 domain-containing protein [Anaerotignaceae bacterium]